MRWFLLPFAFATGLNAQTLEVNIPAMLAIAPNLSEADWRELTQNRTVVYEIRGEVFAIEQYIGNTDLVYVKTAEFGCQNGRWYMQDKAFCFNWEQRAPVCFHHKYLGDDLYVIEVEAGQENGHYQLVTSIDSRPMECAPQMLSRLDFELFIEQGTP